MENMNKHEPRSPVQKDVYEITVVDVGEDADVKLQKGNARFSWISLGSYIGLVAVIVGVIFSLRVIYLRTYSAHSSSLPECTLIQNDSQELRCERAKKDAKDEFEETDDALSAIMTESIAAIAVISVIGLYFIYKKQEREKHIKRD